MNPRQRRGVLMIGASMVLAILVFGLVLSRERSVSERLNPSIQVLALNRQANRFQSVTPDMIKFMSVPRVFAPPQALTGVSQVAGLVAASDLPAGSVLQQGMLLPLPDLRGRERAQTVVVDSASGVAGRLGPDDLVDIQSSATIGGKPTTRVIVSAVRVIAIGESQSGSASSDPNGRRPAGSDGAFSTGSLGESVDKSIVTLALSPQESLRVGYALDFGASFRLIQHRPGDNEKVGGADATLSGPAGG